MTHPRASQTEAKYVQMRASFHSAFDRMDRKMVLKEK